MITLSYGAPAVRIPFPVGESTVLTRRETVRGIDADYVVRPVQLDNAWWDFEATQGATISYTRRGSEERSPAEVMPQAGPWLVPVDDPAKCVRMQIDQDGFAGSSQKTVQSVAEIPGAARDYVVNFGRKAMSSSIKLLAYRTPAYDRLYACLQVGGVYFISSPHKIWPLRDHPRHVMLGDLSWTPMFAVSEPIWSVDIPLTPVDAPSWSQRQTPWGWPTLPTSWAGLPDQWGKIPGPAKPTLQSGSA